MKKNHTQRKSANTPVVKKSRNKKEEATLKIESPFFAIAIGASAGGINAVTELLSQIPAQINAAIFLVMHITKAETSYMLAEQIKRVSGLKCKVASDHSLVERGSVYLAPANAHLLVKDGRILIGHGPPENRFRPSIDILFRSVASEFGERSIGIILTGYLSDGTTGMFAIKQSGGHCIVQNPSEAEYPDMPLSVMENMKVDYSTSLKDMSNTIQMIIHKKKINGIAPPKEVMAESRLSEKAATSVSSIEKLGNGSEFICPDCGGNLWLINKPFPQYRCHIGHSYMEKDLLSKQTETIEGTLWVSLRMMEEKKMHLQKIANEYSAKGYQKLSTQFHERSVHLDVHVDKLKELLFAINKD